MGSLKGMDAGEMETLARAVFGSQSSGHAKQLKGALELWSWLDELGLASFAEAFALAGYDDMSSIQGMDAAEMKVLTDTVFPGRPGDSQRAG